MDTDKNLIKDPPPTPSTFLKKWWIDNRERISEWYRTYFHTLMVTIIMFFNLVLGYSGLIIYLSRWKHMTGSPEAALSIFFDEAPKWLLDIMNFFFIPFDTWHIGWMLIIFNLPLLNWFYSTITQPIKKGFTTIISWKSPKGRLWAFLLSAGPFITIYLALISFYVDKVLFDFFASVTSDKDFLVVSSMESFGYVLMVLPVGLVFFGIFVIAKQFYMFEDLQEQFKTWEFPLLSRQSFSLKGKNADVIVGWEEKTKKPIVISEGSRFLHEIIDGATGTGKTSTTLLIRVVQDLIRIARGNKQSLIILEPKGDMVQDVLALAEKLGIPNEKIKVIDPTDKIRSIKFNPFMGPMEAAAESFRGSLEALSGDQDPFFKGQQNETASLYTMLGKLRYGNLFNIVHMQRMYSDPRYLADITEDVRASLERQFGRGEITPEQRSTIERYDRVVSYFEDEVLEYKTYKDKNTQKDTPLTYSENHRYAGRQVVENKKDKYVAGAKKYLNDIAMNALLSDLMVGNDDDEVLNLDEFLADGGIVLVNSALGELEELSLIFGQFFIRQFQSAVFRRPKDGASYVKKDIHGNEHEVVYSRIPTFFYVDEFPLYANESFERMLTLGRSYKVGSVIAIQNIGQLKKVLPNYDKIILGNARNKTVFGGGEYDDNEYFSNQFGEEYQIEESLNESSTPWTMPGQRWDHRYNTQRKLMPRFSPTHIMELPFKHFIIQRVDEENNLVPPIEAVGKFVSETKFIKKFVNVGKLQLATENDNPLDIANQLNNFKGLISAALTSEKTEQKFEDVNDINGENVDSSIEKVLDEVPVDFDLEIEQSINNNTESNEENIQPEMSEVNTQEPIQRKNIQERESDIEPKIETIPITNTKQAAASTIEKLPKNLVTFVNHKVTKKKKTIPQVKDTNEHIPKKEVFDSNVSVPDADIAKEVDELITQANEGLGNDTGAESTGWTLVGVEEDDNVFAETEEKKEQQGQKLMNIGTEVEDDI